MTALLRCPYQGHVESDRLVVRHAVRPRVEPSQFIEEMGLKGAEEKRAKVLS